jgi:hypothetical protein
MIRRMGCRAQNLRQLLLIGARRLKAFWQHCLPRPQEIGKNFSCFGHGRSGGNLPNCQWAVHALNCTAKPSRVKTRLCAMTLPIFPL